MLTSDRFGNLNKAYSLDGVSNYIDIGDWSMGGELSISVWVNYAAFNSQSRVVNFSNGQYTNSIVLANSLLTNSGYLYSEATPTVQLPNLFSLNNWDFYVLQFLSNLSCEIYKNGILDTTISMTSPLPNLLRTNQFFGKSDFSIDGYFQGKLDDIGIWNRALTQQEITDLYNGNICYQTITVTDTLLINMGITGFNPVTYNNTIKIFPNPTNDHITIDYGNFASLSGYQLLIENSLGQQVFQTSINQQSNYLSLNNWGGNGLYFVRIIDPQGNTVDIRKIVLQ
jgi:hypothetical protein